MYLVSKIKGLFGWLPICDNQCNNNPIAESNPTNGGKPSGTEDPYTETSNNGGNLITIPDNLPLGIPLCDATPQVPSECQWDRLPGAPIPSSTQPDIFTKSKTAFFIFPEAATNSDEYRFVSCYSRKAKRPLWTAEILNKEIVYGQCTRNVCERPLTFNQDARLCPAEQDDHSWYSGSGYDRGHLIPNANFGDESLRAETFSMVNIIPQSPDRNRELWRELEESIRNLVKRGPFEEVVSYTVPVYRKDGQIPVKGSSDLFHNAKDDMFLPVFIFKFIACVDQEKNAKVMVCYSDNFNNGGEEDKETKLIPGKFGGHVKVCQIEPAKRCVALSDMSKELNDKCFEDTSDPKLTYGDLITRFGLDWSNVKQQINSKWNVIEGKTCFE